jgi:hypothetical protein
MAHRAAMKPPHLPKMQNPFSPKSPLAVKPPGFMAKPPTPVIPRAGGLPLNNGPLSGSSPPALMAGLNAKPKIATPLNTSLPGLPPKLP